MSFQDTSVDNSEAIAHRSNQIRSELLLRSLRQAHYDHAPTEFKDKHLPVLYVDPNQISPAPVCHMPATDVGIELSGIPPAQPLKSVLSEVCASYEIPSWRILGDQRTKDLIIPRHVAMYLGAYFSPLPIAQIARFFKRDHTVILHARKSIEKKLLTDSSLARRVNYLKWKIGGSSSQESVDQIAQMRANASQKFAAKFKRLEAAQ